MEMLLDLFGFFATVALVALILAAAAALILLAIRRWPAVEDASPAGRGDGALPASAPEPEPEPTTALKPIAAEDLAADAEAAGRWWEEKTRLPVIEINGAAAVCVEGSGVAVVDGGARHLAKGTSFEVLAEATIRSSAGLRIKFEKEIQVRIGSAGSIAATGQGEIAIADGGAARLRGTGKYKVSSCRDVSTSLLSRELELEATDCGKVAVCDQCTLRALRSRTVFVLDSARALVRECDEVYADGHAVVYAVKCRTVNALGDASVKHRDCAEVKKISERAVVVAE